MKKIYLLLANAFILLCLGGMRLSAQNYSLYAVADSGGAFGDGVLYRYDHPSGRYTVLMNFNGTNGTNPGSKMVIASNGYLYGVARLGGTSGDGVIFRYDLTTGQDTVLHNFNGADGENPPALSLQATNGLLYGETRYGGTYGSGTLYSFDPVTNIMTVLVNLHDTIGEYPDGFVQQATNGLLYAHTTNGGKYGDGVLYSYNINTGKDSVVINFDGLNGSTSREFRQADNGIIYGVAQYGGTANDGVLYSYNPVNGDDSVLINFGYSNGLNPTGYPYQANNGLLFCHTNMGGTNNNGIMYTYNITTGQDSIFYNFPASGLMGQNPTGVAFIQAPDGLLYIQVPSGGLYGMGVLLTVDPVTYAVNKVFDFGGTNGTHPQSFLLLLTCQFDETSKYIPEAGTSKTGINTLDNTETSIRLYPNPNNGVFNVYCHPDSYRDEQSEESLTIVEIYNVMGEKVLADNLRSAQGENHVELNNQPAGMYFYRVIKVNGSLIGEGKMIIEK